MPLKIEISPHDKTLALGFLFCILAFSIFLVYGNKLVIPQLEQKYLHQIQFTAPPMNIPGSSFSNTNFSQYSIATPIIVKLPPIPPVITKPLIIPAVMMPVVNTIAPEPKKVPSSGTDQFGIKKLYPSVFGGESWVLSNDPNHDPQITGGESNVGSFANNGDGSFNVQSSEVRLGIQTSTGYDPNSIKTLNQGEMAKQGFMQAANDWKNVEITAYFKVNSHTASTQNGAAHIELGAHGSQNSNGQLVGGLDISCGATAYHSNTYLDGRAKFEKDLQHIQGYTTDSSDPTSRGQINTNAFNSWIGIKAVIYDDSAGHVTLEQWVDDSNNNNWHKVLAFTDSGQWGPTKGNIGGACGGSNFQIASWGGPLSLIRWDNIDNMDIKNASVREIISPGQ